MWTTLARVATVGLFVAPALAGADAKVDQTVAKAIAQIEKNRDKLDEPLKSAAKLAKDGAKKPDAAVGASRIFEAAGRLDEALANARTAVAAKPPGTGPTRALALAQLAGLELRVGSSKDALAHAVEAAAASPSTDVSALLARAQASRRDPAALETAEGVVKSAPTSALAHEARGWALFAAGKNEEAAAAFAKAIELDVKLYPAYVGRGRSLVELGKAAEAETVARAATTLDKNQPEAFSVLAEALLAKDPKNWGAAIDAAQQAALATPKSAYAQHVVGKLFEAAGNTKNAAESYGEAVKSDPSYKEASLRLVKLQLQDGKLAEVMPVASRLAEELPGDAEAQMLYGELLVRKNDYAGALDPLERAVKLAPKNADAHGLLAQAYEKNHQLDEAEASWNMATKLAPERKDFKAAAYIRLGRIYRSAEPRRLSDAFMVYKKALEADPKSAEAHLGMGWAFYLSQSWTKAIDSFGKAIKLDARVTGDASIGMGWSEYWILTAAGNKNLQKAHDAARQAKAAGDPRAPRLLEVIDAYEHRKETLKPTLAAAPVDECPDLSGLVTQSRDGSDAARGAAIRSMVCSGKEAVPYLVPLLSDPQVTLAVKTAAAKSLGAIGAAAKAACAPLQAEIAASQQRIILPKEDLSAQEQARQLLRERDFQDAARAAIQKICGK